MMLATIAPFTEETRMKIRTDTQQPTVAQEKVSRGEDAQTGAVQQKKSAKAQPKGDTVKLSSSLDSELQSREAEQAQRVDTIKGLVKSGKYQVNSRDVAEKMLSGKSNS